MTKRLSDQANISAVRVAEQAGNPSTPPSGFGQIFEKNDGGLYFINDAGSVAGPLSSNPVLMTGTVTYISNVQTIQLQDGLSVAVTGSVAFVKSGVGAVQSWSPTLIQSGTITHTATDAKYMQIGRVIVLWATLAVTGVGVAGNDIKITNLPATPSSNSIYGSGWVYNQDVNTFYVGAVININGILQIRAHLETDDVGTDPSFALANGDIISISVQYPIF